MKVPRPGTPGRFTPAVVGALLCSTFWIGPSFGQPTSAGAATDGLDVQERLAVREAGVLLELPRLRKSAVERLAPSDLVVTAGERSLRTTRIARLDPATEPWTVLIYVDALSADRPAVELSLQTLASQAEALANLGPVTLVVAGTDDQLVLDGTRSTSDLAAALQDLAEMSPGVDTLSLLRRGLSRRPIEDVFVEEVSFLRERADRLLVHAAATCSLPPCLLIQVTDGYEVDPSGVYRAVPLPMLVRQAGGISHGDVAQDLEHGLGALGWTVLSMSLEAPTESREARARPNVGTDFDAWKATTPGVQTGPPGRRKNRHDRHGPQALEVFTEPRLDPLRGLAAATAGAVLRVPGQLADELGRVADRWWLFYLVETDPDVAPPAASASASPDALRVSWAEQGDFQSRRAWKKRLGFVAEEEPLRSPRWARVSSPLQLTEARLRAMQRGAHLVGDLSFQANEAGDDVTALANARPGRIRIDVDSDRPWMRVSAVGAAGSLRHEIVRAEPDETSDLHSVDLPGWARRGIAVIEEVGSVRWAVLGR